tara:strand:- start:4834 stop:5070 length:237 start_codon:yes stop_codon:yes gene_type:complete
MGDNLERIIRENDERLRREAEAMNDTSLLALIRGYEGIQSETPSPIGVDEFPFRDARGIYRYRSTASRKGKSRRKSSK